MFAGLCAARGPATGKVLLVAPAPPTSEEQILLGPAGRWLVGAHPVPDRRSLVAGRALTRFVAGLEASHHLTVLLSGGGSALAVLPAPGLSLEDKRRTTAALARAGADIQALNVVRKHLSAIKGGRLGAATPARTEVLALSDVVGNDPGTIASGPFSADPSTYAHATDILARFGIALPPAVDRHLARGRAGEIDETPKPGSGALAHVTFRILAGPEDALRQACIVARARGYVPEVLADNLEDPVQALVARYAAAARALATAPSGAKLLVASGEPTVRVTGRGRGGRSTHLALLVARAIAGIPGVAFLAAGTDGKDGSTPGAGAVVDGELWRQAIEGGFDPEAALRDFDSVRVLEPLGCIVPGGPGTNLLDLHFLAAASPVP